MKCENCSRRFRCGEGIEIIGVIRGQLCSKKCTLDYINEKWRQ